jgi:hypothetical protein
MLDGVEARLRRLSDRLVERRVQSAAEQIEAGLPGGIAVQRDRDGVCLSGRGLKRRVVLEPALLWLLAGLR